MDAEQKRLKKREYTRKYREKNREKYNEYQRNYYHKNPKKTGEILMRRAIKLMALENK